MEKNGNGVSEIVESERLDVVATDEDLPFLRIVQPRDQLENRALPRAVRANDDLHMKMSMIPLSCSAVESAYT